VPPNPWNDSVPTSSEGWTRTKTPDLRIAKFKSEYPVLFWLHWALDFLLQFIFVAAIVVAVVVIGYNGVVTTFNLGS
jgi:hypothetical protein